MRTSGDGTQESAFKLAHQVRYGHDFENHCPRDLPVRLVIWFFSPQHITGTRTSERSDRLREKTEKTTWLKTKIVLGNEVQVSGPACFGENRGEARSHDCCSHGQLSDQEEVVILLGSLETA